MASVDEDSNSVRVVAVAMLVLSWVAVLLRVYVRAFLIRAFGPDDWLSVGTLATFSLHCSFVFYGLTFRTTAIANGNAVAAIFAEIDALKWYWCAILPYIICTALIKWTVGVFLLRFCRVRAHNYTIYITLAIITAYDIAYLFVCIFQCHPVPYFWTQYLGQPGGCFPRLVLTNLSYAAAALNSAADIVLGVLPVFLVRGLQLDLRTKFSVAGVLALGSISCVSTLVRLPYLILLNDPANFLAATTPIAIWGLVELGLGLIAASVVTLKPLFKIWYTGKNPYGSSIGNTYGSRQSKVREFVEIKPVPPPKDKRPMGRALRSESEIELAIMYPDKETV